MASSMRATMNVAEPLLARHFIGFGGAFGIRGEALGVKRNAFEEVHGAVQLDIASATDTFLFLCVNRFNAAGRALEGNVALFFLRHGHNDVRHDASLVNDFVTRRVILGGSEPERRTILQRENALHGAFAERLLTNDDGAASTERGGVLETSRNDFR